MNNYFALEDGQFIVSNELLVFLQWLVQNEPEALKKLVKRAMKQGLGATIEKEKLLLSDEQPDLHEVVTDFFSILDIVIAEAHSAWCEEKESQEAREPQFLNSATDHIDCTVCDNEIVELSVARASQALKRNTKLNAEETLYKELLKNWSPRNKNVRH